jgi:hypothetical protein
MIERTLLFQSVLRFKNLNEETIVHRSGVKIRNFHPLDRGSIPRVGDFVVRFLKETHSQTK